MVWNDGITCIVDIELENVTNVSHKTDEGVFFNVTFSDSTSVIELMLYVIE